MCTRVFNSKDKRYLTTARNMDWKTQLPTSLFSFKSGVKKQALDNNDLNGKTNWEWTALYSSVVAMVGAEDHGGYASSDGINSKGLVANVLYDKGSNYKLDGEKNYKPLSVLRWVQYVLDNFATSEEVANAFRNPDIELIQTKVPGSESEASLHLSVSDINGHTTIVEVYNGAYHVHYSNDSLNESDTKINQKNYPVMTNEPNFDIQLQINAYWIWQWDSNNSFPSHTIPGGAFASDRFERASYYYHHLDAPDSFEESLAQTKSVVANASVPLGMKGFEGFPNIAPTLWSVISDHNRLRYYFYNVRTPNVVWINMKDNMPSEAICAVKLITLNGTDFTNIALEGCINDALKAVPNPFFN